MTKDNGFTQYTGLSYYIPRKYNPKRAYPLIARESPLGIWSNKRQAIEVAMNKPDVLLRSVYPSDEATASLATQSSYLPIPGQVRGELVSRPSPSFYAANVTLGIDGMSTGRKDFMNASQFHALETSHNLDVIPKARFDDVLDSKNLVSVPMRSYFGKFDDKGMLRTMSSNMYCDSFLASGRPYYGCNIPVDVIHSEGAHSRLTLGGNNEEANTIVSNRADEGLRKDAYRMAIAKNKAIVDHRSYTHLSKATNQMNIVEPNTHQDNMPMLVIPNGGCDTHELSSRNKDKGKGIVFEGAEASANGEATADNQNSAESSGATSKEGTSEPNAFLIESSSDVEGGAKNLEPHGRKKVTTADEPSPNICSYSNKYLLSTGVFDGAPVKYTLKSRNILLHGVIKGSKILCSCNDCNNSKYISPNKFERHAGGNTKKSYSYIHLENGKTIDQVCQDLRATPSNMFFHRLPEIAGSAFGWLSFNNWKPHSNLDSTPAAPPSIKMPPL